MPKKPSFLKDLVFSCLESRVENNRSLYARFLVGPFLKGQALTVGTALRRALLSSEQLIGISAISIQGITHEFSTIIGVRESVLELSLNFQRVVLRQNGCQPGVQVGYLQVKGPLVVYANDLKLPLGVECVDPTQYIATLSTEGLLVVKFVIHKNLQKQGALLANRKIARVLSDRHKKNGIATQNVCKHVSAYNRSIFNKANATTVPTMYRIPSRHSTSQLKFSILHRQQFERLKATNFLYPSSLPTTKIDKEKSLNNVSSNSFASTWRCQAPLGKCKYVSAYKFPSSYKKMCKAVNTTKLGLQICKKRLDRLDHLPTKFRLVNKAPFCRVYKHLHAHLHFYESVVRWGKVVRSNTYPFWNSLKENEKLRLDLQNGASRHTKMQNNATKTPLCASTLRNNIKPNSVDISSRHRKLLERSFALQTKSLTNTVSTDVLTFPYTAQISTKSDFLQTNSKNSTANNNFGELTRLNLEKAKIFSADFNKFLRPSLNFRKKDRLFRSDICLHNLIPLEFSAAPVNKANFLIESDNETSHLYNQDRERLILEVWTNGSIHPRQAVHEAALSLIDTFSSFRKLFQLKCKHASAYTSYYEKSALSTDHISKVEFCNSVPRLSIMSLKSVNKDLSTLDLNRNTRTKNYVNKSAKKDISKIKSKRLKKLLSDHLLHRDPLLARKAAFCTQAIPKNVNRRFISPAEYPMCTSCVPLKVHVGAAPFYKSKICTRVQEDLYNGCKCKPISELYAKQSVVRGDINAHAFKIHSKSILREKFVLPTKSDSISVKQGRSGFFSSSQRNRTNKFACVSLIPRYPGSVSKKQNLFFCNQFLVTKQ